MVKDVLSKFWQPYNAARGVLCVNLSLRGAGDSAGEASWVGDSGEVQVGPAEYCSQPRYTMPASPERRFKTRRTFNDVAGMDISPHHRMQFISGNEA